MQYGSKYHRCLEGAKADSTYRVTTYVGDKKMLKGPISLERHCNDAIARNAIQGALVLQKLSSDWTSTAFI